MPKLVRVDAEVRDVLRSMQDKYELIFGKKVSVNQALRYFLNLENEGGKADRK